MKHSLFKSLSLAMLLLTGAVWAELPKDAVWIDVRTPGEYAEGHIEGATLIPYDGIEAGINELSLDKDTPVYLYCGSGGRAGIAKEALERQGYTQVTNAGGLQDALVLTGQETPTKPTP